MEKMIICTFWEKDSDTLCRIKADLQVTEHRQDLPDVNAEPADMQGAISALSERQRILTILKYRSHRYG